MNLNEEIIEKIISDNVFSLKLALLLTEKTGEIYKQRSLEMQAQRRSYRLLLPPYIAAYIELGFHESEIIQKEPAL